MTYMDDVRAQIQTAIRPAVIVDANVIGVRPEAAYSFTRVDAVTEEHSVIEDYLLETWEVRGEQRAVDSDRNPQDGDYERVRGAIESVDDVVPNSITAEFINSSERQSETAVGVQFTTRRLVPTRSG